MKKRYVQAMMAGMTVMLSLAMPVTTVWAAVPEKEQTVYVSADENGEKQKVIVSNWLKNSGKDATLEDYSDLEDIKNVKGEESFTAGKDGALTWNADGNDIYYQGETQKELPVSVKMTYFLDGKEIQPSDLSGKSGKVKIRIDYENHSGKEKEINGKKEKICTPFMMVTGMILPTEKFTNIEVQNGKVISDGKNDIVVGMGFPGLADSLKLSDIDGLDEKKLPDYVEVTADVKEFALSMTATVATTGTLRELGLGGIKSMDELEEKLNLLSDSSEALVEGSSALKDGVAQLDASAKTFADGLDSADSGAGKLKDGISLMNSKKGELLKGISQFSDGVKALDGGAGQLKNGVVAYTKGAGELAAGADQLAEGTGALQSGADTLQKSIRAYTDGTAKISEGAGKLYGSLENSMGLFKELPGTVQELGKGVQTLAGAAEQFKGGAEAVQKASGALGSQMDSLKQGIGGAQSAIDAAIQAIDSLEPTEENAAVKAQLQASKQALAGISGAMGNVKIDSASLAQLSEGAKAAAEGAGTMKAGLNAVTEKIGGMNNIQQMAAALLAGVKDLKDGSEALCQNNAALNTGAEQLAGGVKQMNTGAQKLKAGGKELTANSAALVKGAEELAAGTKQLKAGGSQLQSGAGALSDGIGQLAKGADELKGGTGKLAAGGREMKAGTKKLADGSAELADGMQKFDREGISKLVDLLNGESKQVLDRLGAVVDEDEAYTVFDGVNEKAAGNVKFIIETAGIE